MNSRKPFLLKKYCQTRGLDFVVIVALNDPKDLIFVSHVQAQYGCKVIFQKIDGSGRAKKTGSEFVFPCFDKNVFGQHCPNTGTVSYCFSKGFSQCCSNVINNLSEDTYAFPTIKKLFNSRFYKEATQMTFLERLKKHRADFANLKSCYSSPCALCEFIEEHIIAHRK